METTPALTIATLNFENILCNMILAVVVIPTIEKLRSTSHNRKKDKAKNFSLQWKQPLSSLDTNRQRDANRQHDANIRFSEANKFNSGKKF